MFHVLICLEVSCNFSATFENIFGFAPLFPLSCSFFFLKHKQPYTVESKYTYQNDQKLHDTAAFTHFRWRTREVRNFAATDETGRGA